MMIEKTGDFDPIYGYVLPSLPPSRPSSSSFILPFFMSLFPKEEEHHVVVSKKGER